MILVPSRNASLGPDTMLQSFQCHYTHDIFRVMLLHGFPDKKGNGVHLIDAGLLIDKLPKEINVTICPTHKVIENAQSVQLVHHRPRTELDTTCSIKL